MAKRCKIDQEQLDPSFDITPSELDVFSSPKGRNQIISTREVYYTPLGSIDNDGVILFDIPESRDEFTDLMQFWLSIGIKVLEADGTKIPATANYATENLPTEGGGAPKSTKDRQPILSTANDIFDCLFKRIGLEVNSVSVGSNHAFHPQISVIQKLLSHSEEVGKNHLKNAIGWFQDKGERLAEAVLTARYPFIAGSKDIKLMSRLTHDVFTTDRLLPPENRLKLRLERSSPEFWLIRSENSQKTFKVQWDSVRLSILRVKVAENVHQNIRNRFSSTNPYYLPYKRVDGRTFEVPRGSRYYRASNLFSGPLPERGMLVLTSPASLGNGKFSNNPVIFNASKTNISEVQFFVGERAVLPSPLQPKWAQGEWVAEYQQLLNVTGHAVNPVGCCIDYDSFGNDYCIFAARFKGFEGYQDGNISIELQFSDGDTQEPISGLFIAEFSSCMLIDSDKNVSRLDI